MIDWTLVYALIAAKVLCTAFVLGLVCYGLHSAMNPQSGYRCPRGDPDCPRNQD